MTDTGTLGEVRDEPGALGDVQDGLEDQWGGPGRVGGPRGG